MEARWPDGPDPTAQMVSNHWVYRPPSGLYQPLSTLYRPLSDVDHFGINVYTWDVHGALMGETWKSGNNGNNWISKWMANLRKMATTILAFYIPSVVGFPICLGLSIPFELHAFSICPEFVFPQWKHTQTSQVYTCSRLSNGSVVANDVYLPINETFSFYDFMSSS